MYIIIHMYMYTYTCIQLLDNSVLSVGGEGERQDNGLSRQLLTVQNELTECERELKTVQEERDAVKQQLDSLTDKLNVSEVWSNHTYILYMTLTQSCAYVHMCMY